MGKWMLYAIAALLTATFCFLSIKDQTSLHYEIAAGWYVLMGAVVSSVAAATAGVSLSIKRTNGGRDE